MAQQLYIDQFIIRDKEILSIDQFACLFPLIYTAGYQELDGNLETEDGQDLLTEDGQNIELEEAGFTDQYTSNKGEYEPIYPLLQGDKHA